MAADGRWTELSKALLQPLNASAAVELLRPLEALGDQALEAKQFNDASNSYMAAQFCATLQVQSKPYSDPDSPAAQTAMYRIGEKLRTTAERFAEESQDTRTVTAEPRAGQKAPSPHAAVKTIARPIRDKPPSDDMESLIGRIAAFAREGKRGMWWPLVATPKIRSSKPQAAKRFEVLGDESRDRGEWFPAGELYAVALGALGPVAKTDMDWFVTLREKAVAMTNKVVDQRIANPLPAGAPLPEPLDWDNGWERVEWLVLSGRFGEADELIPRLEQIPDRYQDRGWDWLFRFSVLPDHLIEDHPEMARWFYERLYLAAWAMPADTASEGQIRDREMDEAQNKVEKTSARIPSRVATIDAVLSSNGMGPRPEPERYVKTVGDEQVLELVPERSLFTTQSAEDGASEPIPERQLPRYALHVRIQGNEVRLTPRADKYGMVRPLSFSTSRQFIRLEPDKPAVIEYDVPGGGPVWTLTLMEIRRRD